MEQGKEGKGEKLLAAVLKPLHMDYGDVIDSTLT
jgi:hypothetical protein